MFGYYKFVFSDNFDNFVDFLDYFDYYNFYLADCTIFGYDCCCFGCCNFFVDVGYILVISWSADYFLVSSYYFDNYYWSIFYSDSDLNNSVDVSGKAFS